MNRVNPFEAVAGGSSVVFENFQVPMYSLLAAVALGGGSITLCGIVSRWIRDDHEQKTPDGPSTWGLEPESSSCHSPKWGRRDECMPRRKNPASQGISERQHGQQDTQGVWEDKPGCSPCGSAESDKTGN
ncbi:hypothetical protein DAEQUDRAFT_741682 [Daedalea quercina L-15889]|uniref:Uncharacterized protein n=1 Tax=Daedalea quercina L-15889 TaxID=1314783 RepID=A0A165L0K8_9APHY|nr:hypothetical protein DAEQUDRAFT_741682 [Daedalea quercina L-15889]